MTVARGGRLRELKTALIVGAAALAIALVTTLIAVFTNGDGGGRPAPAEPSLTESVLLTAEEVPGRERLTEWEEADQSGETLACAPERISSLDPASSVRRDFAAGPTGGPAEPLRPLVVRTEVMEFGGDGTAQTAYGTTLGWILD